MEKRIIEVLVCDENHKTRLRPVEVEVDTFNNTTFGFLEVTELPNNNDIKCGIIVVPFGCSLGNLCYNTKDEAIEAAKKISKKLCNLDEWKNVMKDAHKNLIEYGYSDCSKLRALDISEVYEDLK